MNRLAPVGKKMNDLYDNTPTRDVVTTRRWLYPSVRAQSNVKCEI